jgi:hypothetical protein
VGRIGSKSICISGPSMGRAISRGFRSRWGNHDPYLSDLRGGNEHSASKSRPRGTLAGGSATMTVYGTCSSGWQAEYRNMGVRTSIEPERLEQRAGGLLQEQSSNLNQW